MDFVRTYSEKYDNWDNLAPFATFTYNTSVHASTNFTPFELVYRRLARFPTWIPAAEQLRTYNLYLQDLITRLNEMKIQAADNQIKAKEKSKERYDRQVKPLKIKAILGRNNVLLELPNGKTIRKHTDKLKIVHPSDSDTN